MRRRRRAGVALARSGAAAQPALPFSSPSRRPLSLSPLPLQIHESCFCWPLPFTPLPFALPFASSHMLSDTLHTTYYYCAAQQPNYAPSSPPYTQTDTDTRTQPAEPGFLPPRPPFRPQPHTDLPSYRVFSSARRPRGSRLHLPQNAPTQSNSPLPLQSGPDCCQTGGGVDG